ncbi:MAG: hypothetical protein ACRCYY_05100 [Trueperaceae bacterium]
MSITASDLQKIASTYEGLLNQKVWQIQLGIGSFITFDFGERQVVEPGRERGAWHLWVYCCAWRLDHHDTFLVASEDKREKLEKTIQALNNKTLVAIEVQPPAFGTTLTFEEGYVLHLFPVFSEDYEHWMLFTPDGNVLTIGPGTQYTFEPSTFKAE